MRIIEITCTSDVYKRGRNCTRYGTTNYEPDSQQAYQTQVRRGHSYRDTIHAALLKHTRWTDEETVVKIFQSMGGKRSIGMMKKHKKDVHNQEQNEMLIPEWCTSHSAIALITMTQQMANVSKAGIDFHTVSAGGHAFAAYASIIRHHMGAVKATRARTRTMPTVNQAVCIAASWTPEHLEDFTNLSSNTRILFVSANEDLLAQQVHVTEALRRDCEERNDGPRIANIRFEGARRTTEELLGRSRHHLNDVYRSIAVNEWEYIPHNRWQDKIDEKSEDPAQAEYINENREVDLDQLRTLIPICPMNQKYEIFAVDLLYETMARKDGTLNQPKATAYILTVQKILAKIGVETQAKLLTNQGWETLENFIKATNENYQDTPLDMRVCKALMREHNVHPTAYAYIQFCTVALAYFIDATQSKTKEKSSRHQQNLRKQEENQTGPKLLIEGNSVTKGYGPEYNTNTIQIQDMVLKSERWAIVTITVESRNYLIPKENKGNISAEEAKKETHRQFTRAQKAEILEGSGLAIWADPAENEQTMDTFGNAGLTKGMYIEISLGPSLPAINGIVQDYQSHGNKKNSTWQEKSNITYLTMIIRCENVEWLTQEAKDGRPREVQAIAKSKALLQTKNWASILKAQDIDHLSANGALPGIQEEWERLAFENDSKVRQLQSKARIPQQALEAEQECLKVTEKIMQECIGNEELIITLMGMAHNEEEEENPNPEWTAAQWNTSEAELERELAEKTPTISRSIALNGKRGTAALITELLQSDSPVIADLIYGTSQRLLGSYVEPRVGPPGTGKSTTLIFQILIRAITTRRERTLIVSAQNAATETLAHGITKMVGKRANVLGLTARQVGHSQQETPSFTEIDASPKDLKEATTTISTVGMAKQEMAKNFPAYDTNKITRLIIEEKQMAIGHPDSQIFPVTFGKVRENGGVVIPTGDPKQENGGRATQHDQFMTRNTTHMKAGGSDTHSGLGTINEILAAIEPISYKEIDEESLEK